MDERDEFRVRQDILLDEVVRLRKTVANYETQLDMLTRSPFVRMVLADVASPEHGAYFSGKRRT